MPNVLDHTPVEVEGVVISVTMSRLIVFVQPPLGELLHDFPEPVSVGQALFLRDVT